MTDYYRALKPILTKGLEHMQQAGVILEIIEREPKVVENEQLSLFDVKEYDRLGFGGHRAQKKCTCNQR